MLILALETATMTGSAALAEAPSSVESDSSALRIIGEITLHLRSTHSERLMPSIHSLLEQASFRIQDIQALAVGLGPGSFTGLRIGVSTVKGLAYALKVPVAGVSTLETLARNAAFFPGALCPMLDARKKEVYAAFFRGNENGEICRRSEDWVLSPEELCRRIGEKTLFLGNGVDGYGELLRKTLGPLALFASPPLSFPRAAIVAELALRKIQTGQTLDLFSFTPTYIRRSEAEIHYEARRTTNG